METTIDDYKKALKDLDTFINYIFENIDIPNYQHLVMFRRLEEIKKKNIYAFSSIY